MKEICINTASNMKSAYNLCVESFDDILRTRTSLVNFKGLEMSKEDKKLPYLYISKSTQHRFVAGCSKSTT